MTTTDAAAQAQALIARAKQAMAAHSEGDATAAEQHYAAVAPYVQHPGLYVGYAGLLTQTGKPAAAAWRRRALAFYPNNGGAVELAGAAALATGDNREAAKWLRRRLRLGGDLAAAHDALGVALTRAGDAAEGARQCREAVRLCPDNADRHYNLAVAQEAAGCLTGARTSYRRALTLRPDHPGALENSALAAVLAGDAAAARRLFGRLTKLFPQRPELRFLYGESRLAQGDWNGGWADFEARRLTATLAPPRPRPEPPLWRGEALSGGTLLLVGEQGAGDALLLARFIPLAVRRAGRVVLALHDSLLRLIAAQWPDIIADGALRIRPLSAALQAGKDIAAWSALGSLPGLLALDPAEIPAPPYLQADVDLAAAWRRRLDQGRTISDGRRRFGLVWAGNPEYKHDRWRSPGLATLRPLLNVPGWRPVALQAGAGRKQLEATPWPADGVDLGGAVQDFADTAAIIANLDLVISSDTSVLHLAAAMGKATWGVAATRVDWRWRRGDDGRPLWYPLVRLFQQREAGRWDDIVADLRAALELEAR